MVKNLLGLVITGNCLFGWSQIVLLSKCNGYFDRSYSFSVLFNNLSS